MNLKIYGIRHHGAGSAKRLIQALQKQKPDCICLELPWESDELIPHFNNRDLIPPIGLLFYDPANTHHSITLPMAEFSPEYQAIIYGLQHGIPVKSIDLPAAHFLKTRNFSIPTEQRLNAEQQRIVADPIAYLAFRDGYTDSENWWELHFEHWTESDDLFQHILELMKVLREQSDGLDDEETLIREQWMRNQIRNCIKSGKKNLALVCGAWHGPVLTWEYISANAAEQIKTLKSSKIQSTLIPWSYRHLRLDSGYGAGLASPMWHESLFKGSDQAVSYFLSHAAQLLRKEGIEIGTSEVIDAEKLAYNLAVLRKLPIPGIPEVMAAATCIFGKGRPERMDWIEDLALTGLKNGEVPLSHQNLPTVREFYGKLRQLRLKKFWGEAEERKLELDLRKEKHLRISRFLHSVLLADLKWVRPTELDIDTKGNFHEHWSFSWQAYLEIDLIQLALRANVWSHAVLEVLKEKLASDSDDLNVGILLQHSMKANLNEALPILLQKLEEQLLDKNLCKHWLFYIGPITQAIEYGNIHKMDASMLSQFLIKLIPNIIIALPEACSQVNEKEGRAFLQGVVELMIFFENYPKHEYRDLWISQCKKMIRSDTHPLVRGKIWNYLIQKGVIDSEEIRYEMEHLWHQRPDSPPLWLEGFLFQSQAFFLLHPAILKGLDRWIEGLNEQDFHNNLVLLRRIFDLVAPSDKIRIMHTLAQLHNDQSNKSPQYWHFDQPTFEKIQHILDKYFPTGERVGGEK